MNGLSSLEHGLADISRQFAEQALAAGNWEQALGYADQFAVTDPEAARPLQAEASHRLARRSVVSGDFVSAQRLAERAVALNPRERAYQEELRLIRKAARKVLREHAARFFPDAVGSGSGQWWRQDLLGRVRGWDGQAASVAAPQIMGEIQREHLEGIYALGTYIPWHEQGIPPRFTQYVRELKKHGRTIPQAAILLWQGLTCDHESGAPDWIEEIDVVIPMATGWRSYEVRGREITEELAQELANLLCVPCADVFERDPEAGQTHHLSGFEPRLAALLSELRLKHADVANVAQARGALIVDDVVTYGATFEACATLLTSAHPDLRCFGAALAYTETEARRRKAEAEAE